LLKNLLIYRLTIFNLFCVMGLVWAWQEGWVNDMFSKDASYMTYVAAVLLVLGTISTFMRAVKVGNALNELKSGHGIQINGVKFLEKNAHLEDIGNLIVTVGLTGTAIGVVMMLHSFSAGNLSDPSKVVETATALGDGVGTAFRSTIVSAIAWMWSVVNYRMLKTATVLMLCDADAM
jgi:hypothetical protein